MHFRTTPRFLVLFFLILVLPFSQISCTSSDEGDSSILEGELETMGDIEDPMVDDLEGLDDIAEEDLQDIVGEEGSELSELDDEFAEAGDDSVEGDELSGDLADEEFSDDEFSDEDFAGDGGSDQVAGGGDEFDEFNEFNEFDELEGEGGKDPFAQDEQALANELNKQNPGDYPVAQNAQPQFPEEVVGANPAPGTAPPPMLQGVPGGPLPPGGPIITSETQNIMDDMPDPIEPTIPQDDLGMSDPLVPPADGEMPDEPSWVPVVKVKTDPFFRNQRLMNAVYIARPDESLGDISQKIYGEDRSREMLSDNPHLEKGIDPGDKVYYNSPNRSADKSTLKVYYEDVGLPPQFYKTKKNDNMRRLGTKLLGFSEGWKEIWALNSQVDSKSILESGLELKYWTGNEAKQSLELADNSSKNDTTMDPMESEEFGGGAGLTQDPFQESELPPEPPLPEAQVGGPDPTLEPQDVPDIEPFPEDGIEEAPIPPPQQQASVQRVEDNGSLLSIGAVALLIMAGAGLVAIQIKKRKDHTGMSPGSLEYTQV